MRNFFSALLLALAAPALAQQKISVVPFEGPGAATARNQIVAALCDQAECVPQAKVSARGKPDWKKAKKLGVKFFVDGKLTKKGKKATLELQVFSKPGKPKFKKAWPLKGPELSATQLSQAIAVLSKAMGLEPPAAKEEEAEEKPKKEEAEEKPKQEEEEKPKKEEAKQEEDKPRKEPRKDEAEDRDERRDERTDEEREEKRDEELPPVPSDKPKHTIVAGDLGLEFAGKYFSYTQTLSDPLRSYNAPLTVAPSFHLEFYPLALFTQGLFAGLGIDGGAAFVAGLRSRLPDDPVAYPTSIVRVDLGARYRIRPFAGSDAAIVPQVGYRLQTFKVGAAPDGSTINGLPGISYSALKLGVGGEIPIGDRLTFAATFLAMPLLGAGEIISAAWFPRGGGFGFEISAAMTLKLIGPLHLKVQGNFTRYGLSFQYQDTDTYRATGAVDLYPGGFVGVRLAF